jgi:hypothetical protein
MRTNDSRATAAALRWAATSPAIIDSRRVRPHYRRLPQVLLSAVAPYTTCSLAWPGQELGTSSGEAEASLVAAILDGRMAVTVYQVRSTGVAQLL